MTAPTPEYLRELAGLGPMIHIESWDTVCAAIRASADEIDRLRDRAIDDAEDRERLRVDFNARAAERDRLRKVIEDAPHHWQCRWDGIVIDDRCTCWKADAL